jgi:two-component sensor histidine kinase
MDTGDLFQEGVTVARGSMTWRQAFENSIEFSARWPVWLRYTVTLLLVYLVGMFWSHFGTQRPYLLFFPTIIVCAVFLDRGSGFIATFAAALFCAVYLLPPIGSTGIDDPNDRLSLGIFVLIGLLVSGLSEALRLRVRELRGEKEYSLRLAAERKLLVEELAHRTRNDLTSVVTLLNLQASYAPVELRDLFQAAAERVRTIARVHRRLEIAGDRVVVDSQSFFEELCADLQISRLSHRPISMDCRAESHNIGIEKAVPLGLIVNELVTNAAKHAFPDNQTGKILVRFFRQGAAYVLEVQDTGIGPSNKSRDGIGTQLLGLLSGQLGGQFEHGAVKTGSGTRAVVEVPFKGEG